MYHWMAEPLNAGDRHTHTHTIHIHILPSITMSSEYCRGLGSICSLKASHTHTHTHIIYTVKCRHSDIHWPWLLRGPCLCVRVCALRKHHLPSSPLPLPFSFYWGSDLLSSLCQPWSCQQSVQWAKSEEKKEKRQAKKKNGEHDARRCQKSPLLCWHLDLHISFSWVTKYINTLQVEQLGKLHTCTHTALTLAFWMNLRKGRGIWHLVFDLWSSLLLSLCWWWAMSQVRWGIFFFFHLERYWQW